MLKAYPNLKLYVREGMPRALLDALDVGGLDLLMFPLPVAGADLESARLFREPLLVAVPAGHPLARRKFAERADLKGETVLTLERGHRLHDQVAQLCQEMGAKLTLDYEGTSLDTLRQMVGMGMGLTFLPGAVCESGNGVRSAGRRASIPDQRAQPRHRHDLAAPIGARQGIPRARRDCARHP
ncbi:MAG: hypothetical protein EXQ89_05075 [Rhodospirillaceae bacterium]|nr:hypothetical protein [Rhodospirillaceae bacterium]